MSDYVLGCLAVALLVCVVGLIYTINGRCSDPVTHSLSAIPAPKPGSGAPPNDRWRRIVVIDCEGTGITSSDRLVSLSAIFIDLTKCDSSGNLTGHAKV